MPLRWKVCGITDAVGAEAAVAAGADAVGFVFYPPSPRSVVPSVAASIVAELPHETWRIGVFVDADAAEMSAVVETVGLDFIQLSGDEPPEIATQLPRHAFKVLRLGASMDADEATVLADRYSACTLLLDTAVSGSYGGSGLTGNWGAAAALAQRHRLVLAGGLTADNVAEAVRTVGPWAVDVASGVESGPGIKDPEKLYPGQRLRIPELDPEEREALRREAEGLSGN